MNMIQLITNRSFPAVSAGILGTDWMHDILGMKGSNAWFCDWPVWDCSIEKGLFGDIFMNPKTSRYCYPDHYSIALEP